ncbi:MAG: AAA family ATPase [Chloroflexota bacterium]|nr:AAA family ATPase [Chloroflexota bacterium]MDE2910824.1 AAA family ATPase [Chloroflexota bacterium]
MIKLKNVTINKYKCIETEQSFDVEDDVTVLVGKNESGKSAILEAISKSNSFFGDRFDIMTDYPRKEVTRFQRRQDDITVIKCDYTLAEKLVKQIQEDVGTESFVKSDILHETSYRAGSRHQKDIDVSLSAFLEYKCGQFTFEDETFCKRIREIETQQDLQSLRNDFQSDAQQEFLDRLATYLPSESDDLQTALRKYVFNKWIDRHLPKFLYYNDYYKLDSDIDIRKVQRNEGEENSLKTAKALFDLAYIKIDRFLETRDYETYKAQLEATSNEITDILFEYWRTNQNLKVVFDVERPESDYHSPILKIRLENTKYGVTLPLASRSRGFNWFFSFLVWFSKIQEDRNNQYILLLDEPGLNLHASAQKDLLRFIEDLTSNEEFSNNFQLIYTTHSAAMIESNKLQRVRTVFESDEGTRISDAATETDPDTLIPLYGALGYDIAQNLFISTNNLLVEGPSDLIYLTVMSALLESKNRTSLRDDIAIVPVGGADKVATFIALIRGQELNIVCLLDTFSNPSSKQRLDDMVEGKITGTRYVKYFHQFLGAGRREADIEDLFEPEEFLSLYNDTLHFNLGVKELDQSLSRIVEQIRAIQGKFNAHYQVSKKFAERADDEGFVSEATLERFEKMFQAINKLF